MYKTSIKFHKIVLSFLLGLSFDSTLHWQTENRGNDVMGLFCECGLRYAKSGFTAGQGNGCQRERLLSLSVTCRLSDETALLTWLVRVCALSFFHLCHRMINAVAGSMLWYTIEWSILVYGQRPRGKIICSLPVLILWSPSFRSRYFTLITWNRTWKLNSYFHAYE